MRMFDVQGIEIAAEARRPPVDPIHGRHRSSARVGSSRRSIIPGAAHAGSRSPRIHPCRRTYCRSIRNASALSPISTRPNATSASGQPIESTKCWPVNHPV